MSEHHPTQRIHQFLGWLVLISLTLLGAWYRFHHLELKPLHHDEGVNGWFIVRILDEFKYKYNPQNYHGPLLYIFNTLAVLIGGRNAEALRFMPALFGTLAIPACVLFRVQLGWVAVLVMAAFVAIAPIEVYFSRTAIHEIYNFTFNFGFVGGAFAWSATKKRSYLVLAALSLSGLFAIKETTIITVAVVLPAFILSFLLINKPLPGISLRLKGTLRDRLYILLVTARRHYFLNRKAFKTAVIAFFALWFISFTFLLNPVGPAQFFQAFFAWGDTGTAGKGHEKPWPYFFTHLIWPYYRWLTAGCLVGLVWSSLKRDRYALFTLLWLVLIFTAYSIIPYKTPWCIISLSGPVFLGLGFFAREVATVFTNGSWLKRALFTPIALYFALIWILYGFPVALEQRSTWIPPARPTADWKAMLRDARGVTIRTLFPSTDSWTINFEEYDVKGHPFIYVQNVREYLDLINDLHGLIDAAQVDGDDKAPRILMIDAKNPMRWYIQKTGTQKWPKELNETNRKTIPGEVDIIVVAQKISKDVEKLVGDEFLVRKYHERPGRKIDVYVRKSLWMTYEGLAREGQVLEPSPAFKNKSFSDRRTSEMKDSWSKRGMN